MKSIAGEHQSADVHLARGRAAYRDGAWRDAFAALCAADRERALTAPDLEALALSAYLVCRDPEGIRALERAHAGYLDAGDAPGAARCAFWLSLGLLVGGEHAQAAGWARRGTRLLARSGHDGVEEGYLLVPAVLLNERRGELELAFADASAVARIGERFGDVDLVAFALQAQGRIRIREGSVRQGLALLDEAMVPVLAGELASPLFTGLVYCQAIDACEAAFEVRRAREWTDALARWCEAQAQIVNFTGICLVHRAWSLQVRGEWPKAIDEARQACVRLAEDEPGVGAARYREGEIHRLRGELVAAEAAYHDASARGFQPQPGLALLWLARGPAQPAAAAIGRVLAETTDRLGRARLLPAYVEIMLAVGAVPRARAGARELAGIAVHHGPGVVTAMAAQARGAVALAEGDARSALIALREACQAWQDVQAPYELARVRALLGEACRALGDDDSAGWELAAARDAFGSLGAAPDFARVTALLQPARGRCPGGLTPRELEVLRLVAAGGSNKTIARELVLSPRTVDRHVSNILAKLDVPSRTAATTFAHTHNLV